MDQRKKSEQIAAKRAMARPAVLTTSAYGRRSATGERITNAQRAAVRRSAQSARRRFAST